MPDNHRPVTDRSADHRPDIVEEIDKLVEPGAEPGTDAATWTAADEHDTFPWHSADSDAMTAIYIGMTEIDTPMIRRAEPHTDISKLVGDPFTNLIRHLRDVGFWVGDNSHATSEFNAAATAFLKRLLRDVTEGAYAASDQDRDHARTVLNRPDGLSIHGPCLVTGIDDTGQPAAHGEAFQHWFEDIHAEAAHIARVREALEQLGLSGGVVIVNLGDL